MSYQRQGSNFPDGWLPLPLLNYYGSVIRADKPGTGR
jgi:hypothetical protein